MIKRTTTFRFDSHQDLVNALYDIGIKARRVQYDTIYIDTQFDAEIYWDGAELLRKHSIPVDMKLKWRTQMNSWDISDQMHDKFGYTVDVSDVWHRNMDLNTYNLTVEEHKEAVKIIYDAMKGFGYNIGHECSTTETSDNCM